jgi:MFS family permease
LRATGTRSLDLPGLLLSGVALACLIFGFELASRGAASWHLTAALGAVGLLSAALYARHARRTPRPILDFTLMRIQTFGLSVWAGSMSRVAVGAMPFLLPMMLQIGLGMTAARSGLITFSASIGSLVMRGISRRVLRRFGYRGTMIWNGLGAAGFAFACATFRPSGSVLVIYAVLFAGGLSQSLQFVAYNTIAYADVPSDRMSSATSFYSTLQQVTLTLGICIAAAALAASVAIDGHGHPGLPDFSVAFAAVGLIAAIAPLLCARLPPDAGDEMSGHTG